MTEDELALQLAATMLHSVKHSYGSGEAYEKAHKSAQRLEALLSESIALRSSLQMRTSVLIQALQEAHPSCTVWLAPSTGHPTKTAVTVQFVMLGAPHIENAKELQK